MNFVRSSIAPKTIASDTAAKTTWKKKVASKFVLLYASEAKSSPVLLLSMNQPLEPDEVVAGAEADREADRPEHEEVIDRLMRIFPITAPAFFMRDSPTSSIAKPACMNRTRIAATTIQIELTPTSAPDAGSPPAGPAATAASAGADNTSTSAQSGTSRSDLNRMHALLSAGAFAVPAVPARGAGVPAGPSDRCAGYAGVVGWSLARGRRLPRGGSPTGQARQIGPPPGGDGPIDEREWERGRPPCRRRLGLRRPGPPGSRARWTA